MTRQRGIYLYFEDGGAGLGIRCHRDIIADRFVGLLRIVWLVLDLRKEKYFMSVEENKMVVVVSDLPEETSHQYDQIMKELEEAGAGSPEGRLYHVFCTKEGGGLVVSVWESAELFQQFGQTLVPIIKKVGGTPTEPQIYPVGNIIKG